MHILKYIISENIRTTCILYVLVNVNFDLLVGVKMVPKIKYTGTNTIQHCINYTDTYLYVIYCISHLTTYTYMLLYRCQRVNERSRSSHCLSLSSGVAPRRPPTPGRSSTTRVWVPALPRRQRSTSLTWSDTVSPLGTVEMVTMTPFFL